MSRKSTNGSPMREARTTQTVTINTSRSRFSPLLNTNSTINTEEPEPFDMSRVTSDVLPKTDYTYARSGSYSPRYLYSKYTTPNMSRRGLRKFALDSDSNSSIEMEKEPYEQVVIRPGMTLRSGVRLTWEQRLLAMQEEERLRNSSAGLTNSMQAAEGTPTGVLGLRQRAANAAHDSRHVTTSTSTTTTSKSYLVVEDSDDQNEDYTDSKLTEYGEGMETSEYEEWNSGKRHLESGVHMRHSFGMDQVDASDDDIDLSDSRGWQAESERRGFISRFFLFIMTVVTTTTEYSYCAAKRVTSPIWTYLLDPVYCVKTRVISPVWTYLLDPVYRVTTRVISSVWTYLLDPVYHVTTRVISSVWTYLLDPVYRMTTQVMTWVDETVTTFISYFILLDAWVLSRFTRNCCCLCLPLLLLLPLLCGGGYYLYEKTDWKDSAFRQIFTLHTHLFDSRVITPAVKESGRRDWLTRLEIETLVKGMLDPQLQSLQLSMVTIANTGSTHQETWKVGQEDISRRMDSLEEQMAVFFGKTKEDTVNILNLYNEMKPIVMNKEWLNRSEIEELIQSMLNIQMETLRLSLLNVAKEGSPDQEARQRLDAMEKQLANLLIIVDKGNLGKIQEEARLHLETVETQLTELRERTQIALKVSQDDVSVRLEAVEKQVADLLASPKLGEEDLAKLREELMGAIYALRDSMEKKLTTAKDQENWKAKLSGLEMTITNLQTRIQNSQTSHGDMVALTERCCKDDAALLAIIQGEVNRMLADRNQGVAGRVSSAEIQGFIDAALLKYSADKTGLPDYALESTGGSVVNIRCSKTYTKRAATVKLWGIPLYYTVNGPRTVIHPEVLPGNCWPFEGHEGSLVIQLAIPVTPKLFTLEHIGRGQSIFGDNRSAPKNFTVLGLSSESDTKGQILGQYQYDADRMPMQHFHVQMEDPGIFLFIEVRVTSNHGNEEYTCLYRFRVYGLPQDHN